MSIRTEKVSSLIKHEIGTILSRGFSDSTVGFITVTDVHITPDLKIAKIYVSIFGSEEAKQKSLKSLEIHKKQIRHIVGSHLQIKFTPTIEFLLDETMERVNKIEEILKKIHEDDKPTADR